MFKKQKGITLIALIITIIVLLILAGVTIAVITSNESAPKKAADARDANEIGAAKDAATLLVAEETHEYYEAKYVNRTTNVGTPGEYANSVLATAVTRGDLTIQVVGGKLQVTKGSDTTPLVTGTINSDGTITWEGQDSVYSLAKSGAIQRWDTINYNPGTGTTASINLPEGAEIEGTKLASLNLPAGASINGTIDASEASNWVVLDVTENGEVLIMPRTVSETTLTLSGINGYNNAIEALDTVAGIYLNPAQADSARSIRLEDIIKDANTTENDSSTILEQSWNHRYGMNPSTLEITDTGSDSVTPVQTYSGNYINYSAPSFGGYGCAWVASRQVDVYDDRQTTNTPDYGCSFEVYYLDGQYLSTGGSYLVDVFSDGTSRTLSGRDCVVIPVVTLKSSTKLKATSEFYTETATATSPTDEETEFVHSAWSIVE